MAKFVLTHEQQRAFELLRGGVSALAHLNSWDAETILTWLQSSFDGPPGLPAVIREGCIAAIVAVDAHEDEDHEIDTALQGVVRFGEDDADD